MYLHIYVIYISVYMFVPERSSGCGRPWGRISRGTPGSQSWWGSVAGRTTTSSTQRQRSPPSSPQQSDLLLSTRFISLYVYVEVRIKININHINSQVIGLLRLLQKIRRIIGKLILLEQHLSSESYSSVRNRNLYFRARNVPPVQECTYLNPFGARSRRGSSKSTKH